MLLYIYALTDSVLDVDSLAGVCGEPLTLVSATHAIAVCGWMDERPPIDRDPLIAQDQIVRALHARAAALLPMRFGTSVRDVNDAKRAVDALGAKLRDRLDLVRGREQMTLRVLGASGATGATGATGAAGAVRFSGAQPAPTKLVDDTLQANSERASPKRAGGSARAEAGAGRRYLAARHAQSTPAELAPLIDSLRSLQRATHVERGREAGVIGTMYQLIERGSGNSYRHAVEEAATNLASLTVRISGPSPPYAFASMEILR